MFKNNATGITLRSLWGNWPKDKILEFYSEPIQNGAIYSYKLADNFLQWIIHLVKRIRKRKITGFKENVQSYENGSNKERKFPELKLLLNCFHLRITRKDWIRIRKFNPEIIYTLGGSVNILSLTYKISRKLNIPVVVHYMDNWPNQIQYTAPGIENIYHKFLIRNLNKNLERSELCFAISPYMSECYEKMFQVRHVSLMNCVDVKVLSEADVSESENSDVINIVYAGGLHLNRWKKIKNFAEYLLNENFNVKLMMYISDKEKLLYIIKLK